MFTDIVKTRLIESLPENMRAYAYLMRLDRPIGYWLLFWPGAWAIMLAGAITSASAITLVYYLTLFLIGSIVMRGAGCVINDLWDKDLDKHVERTANRPIASGQISKKQAFVFLGGLLLIGLIILLQLNITTIVTGLASVPFVILYPYMKRMTYWPQLFLGVTFSFGALIGWTAVTGEVGWPALLLYAAAIFWTLGYDTVYAYQDIEDDRKVGIKSTALVFGDNPKPFVSVFYAIAFCLILTALFWTTQNMMVKVLLIPTAIQMFWQIRFWKPGDQASSLTTFKSNHLAGFLVFVAIFVAYFM